MPSLKSIRTRIASVKNTQKITRAMKLVAAARLRRAQEAIIAARPYANTLREVIAEIAARAGADAHPLLVPRPEKRVQLVVLTSDRGLAGAFNSQLTRATERYVYENTAAHDDIALAVVGRKGKDHFKRRKVKVIAEHAGVTSALAKERAGELVASAVADFLEGRTDAVYLVYNEFKSAITQKVRIERLLPIAAASLPAGATPTDYVYEPDKATVLARILPMYAEVEVLRALLETIASEFGARMSAMDSATKNSSEMIGKLTLQYNRARQASITKELLEIIGGAEALKG